MQRARRLFGRMRVQVRCNTPQPPNEGGNAIIRLLTLPKQVGTAFGTAWLVQFALSADDALLVRSVGPFHHRGDGKSQIQHIAFIEFPDISPPDGFGPTNDPSDKARAFSLLFN